MERSDFEIVSGYVARFPGLTARDLAARMRNEVNDRFTPKLANQILYRLLAAQMIHRDDSGAKPRWFPVDPSFVGQERRQAYGSPKRPLNQEESDLRLYSISETTIKVLLDHERSPNDPYLVPDWVGTHIVASINANHPFWTLRLSTPSDRALYCMFCAADAYVQWTVAKLHEPPDSTEVQKMRDFALRLCTLLESETLTNG